MKTFFNPIIIFVLTYFLFSLNNSLFSQGEIISNLVFESNVNDITKKVYFENDNLNFFVNNTLVSRLRLEGKPFVFLNGADNNSHGVIKYSFGGKSEKSSFELYLFDNDFKVSFYRKFYFFYEEPLPKILQLTASSVVFLYPASGKAKLIHLNGEKEIDLFIDENIEFFQERIGYILDYNGKVLVILSQIKKNEDYFSRIFLFEPEKFELKYLELDNQVIHKVFNLESKLYISTIDIEPFIKTASYEIKLDLTDIGQSKILKISDELLEGFVKGTQNVVYTKNCFFTLRDQKFSDNLRCFDSEIILDALLSNGFYFVITRLGLSSHLYKFDNKFNVIYREEISRYLTNPELRISGDNKIFLVEKNKTIFMKNISED